MPLWVAAAGCTAFLALAWLTGWREAQDVGDGFDTWWVVDGRGVVLPPRRVASDKRMHALCGFALGLAFTLLTGHPLGALGVVLYAACGWETVEAFPRKPYPRPPALYVGQRRGRWSWRDVVAGVGTAAVACAIGAGVLTLLR